MIWATTITKFVGDREPLIDRDDQRGATRMSEDSAARRMLFINGERHGEVIPERAMKERKGQAIFRDGR